jgi:hypothetical protein
VYFSNAFSKTHVKTRLPSWFTGLQPPEIIRPVGEFGVSESGEFQHKVNAWRFATAKSNPDFSLGHKN